jgi:hypothetical protein
VRRFCASKCYAKCSGLAGSAFANGYEIVAHVPQIDPTNKWFWVGNDVDYEKPIMATP